MYSIQSTLVAVALEQLRPTQMTVGFREVAEKRRSWGRLGAHKRRDTMRQELFPAVKGPGKSFYILDHHHTALALVQEKSDTVQVGLVKDLSHLKADAFWIFLDHYSWVHPYDAGGRRCGFDKMPDRFEALKDDPCRSLAGDVRDVGGFSKSEAPFLEFLWANFFRTELGRKAIRDNPKASLRAALKLAHSDKCAHLPGWAGKR